MNNDNSSLSRDVDEVQDVIQFYDQRGDGRISIGQVGNCLRALSLSPTEKQVELLTQQWSDPGKLIFFKIIFQNTIKIIFVLTQK